MMTGAGTLLAGNQRWQLLGPTPLAVTIIGALVFVFAATASILAQHSMGTSWRIGVDPEEHTGLVTSGLFAIVRNPFFTASMTLTVGTVIIAPNILTLLGTLAYASGVHLQVRLDEEPALRNLHGASYENYSQNVGRFIPRLTR